MIPFIQLFPRLVNHQWKEMIRSSSWQKSILINIMLGIFLVYLLINLILLGLFLGKIMDSVFPDADPVTAFSGILLYYFIADFIFRFLMQPSPALSVMPYLHLPVRKNSIFHFLLVKSGFSLFNFFPLIVLIPFTLREVIPGYSPTTGITWLIAVILLIFANNYLAFFFRKLFSVKPSVFIIIAAVTALLFWFDFSQSRIISLGFGNWLMAIAINPVWVVVPAILFILSYSLSWFFLYRQRYLEMEEKQSRQYKSSAGSRYISEIFGVSGALMSLEIKMILRNNRPKTYLVLSMMFMFYGFLIYTKHPVESGYGMMLFIGLLLTGIMMIQYGQLVLSWESSYFDRLCTANFTTRDFFIAKFRLFFFFNTVTFLITMPYALYDYRILLLNFAAWLFNCGINIFVILFLGSFNTKRVDMSKGSFFNYEGVTAVHFILSIPALGFPVLIYWLVSIIVNPDAGIVAVGLIGLAGLIFHRQLIDIVARQFLARKQIILHGFRNG
ncbi:MAG: DUF5687 family protein [Bacteroidetes bacterium]|nr:DUF5687 family protein [Bacteroidota bacterium]